MKQGNKARTVYIGKKTARAIFDYLKEEPRDADDPLFLADWGSQAGELLTRSGLQQLIGRLGKAAGIEATRCSPHTFRHTAAIMLLRNGGNQFSLKEMLGHSSLHMTNRYVVLAQADVEAQQRAFSPVDSLKKR